jgi:hypothetical protein
MQFDNNSPWSATATAFHLKDGRAALDFSISAQYVDRWIEEFAAGDVLYIRFPGSDVEEWEANLRGTRTIARTLAQCINEM